MIAMKTVTIANTSKIAPYKTYRCGYGEDHECEYKGNGWCLNTCEFPF